jgi:uncharacterized protein
MRDDLTRWALRSFAALLVNVPLVAGGVATAEPAVARRIYEIQGGGHVSPFSGGPAEQVPGVVTAVGDNGFWMQNPWPDDDAATSEGIFVFTRTRPGVLAGDVVRVDGRVSEFRPGGAASANLSRTEIDASTVAVDAHGVPLPEPVLVGTGKWRAPGSVVDDDADGDVENSGRFEPEDDGLDFYESLEGMRIAVTDAVAVGPRSAFGEVPVLPSDGDGAGPRTARGGILREDDDPNPERIILDDLLTALPALDAADRLRGRTTGVLDYSFGDFKLLVTTPGLREAAARPAEPVRAARAGEFTLAVIDLKNLDPDDPPARFADLARQIVTGLHAPDLLSVTGLQDNSGPVDDGTVAADQTVAELVAAIGAAGGPAYDWRSIDPDDNADGGEPGGNMRLGFLFRADRGLTFTDRPGGTATTTTSVTEGVGLAVSPGRIAPADPVWTEVRKPLAGEFDWRGRQLFVIANHWTSRGLDDPLFGRFQPPRRPSEEQHGKQAEVLADFVSELGDLQRDSYVVVAGRFNAPKPALRALEKDAGLRDLTERDVPRDDRYTAVSAGNAELLDRVLVSRELADRPHETKIVHMNAESAQRAADDDPVLVRFELD